MNVNDITDEEHLTLQRVQGAKILGAPAHPELLAEAAPLVAKGWIVRNGIDLSIPDDVMWDLIRIGKPVKSR